MYIIIICFLVLFEEPGWLSGIALGYGLDDWVFESRQWLGIVHFTTASRPALGPTQSPIQWVPGTLSLGVKWPVCEADHSPPTSAEVKNAWSHNSTRLITVHGVVLSKKKSTGITLPFWGHLMMIYHNILVSSFDFYECEMLSLVLRKEGKIKVFGNKISRKVFGPNKGTFIGIEVNYVMRSTVRAHFLLIMLGQKNQINCDKGKLYIVA
jgi:hypothetical protein